ncbi:phage antirepressor KilAC domain-containing protein [Fructobacillus tropaeoli]|uniref:KilAC domain (KilAC) n=1 Tax=Fructobacillus tropaeoli TaxID=709323 RepID=A0ABM9MNH5_9LACO|nr:KilAC domain (KilAC) [Fructobacillus tropaeoli]CAK1234598.1 KilAC domain (KilAC) [Fructobacillus tropaeoli]
MSEFNLINLNESAGKEPTVSARELYKALQVNWRFSEWWKSASRTLVEGQDFQPVGTPTPLKNRSGIAVKVLQDYQIDVRSAKHIAMMSQTEVGHQIRDYFIDIEERFNDPMYKMSQMVIFAQNQMKLVMDDANFGKRIKSSKDTSSVKTLAEFLTQNGFRIGQNTLFKLLRDEGYLCRRKGESFNLPNHQFVKQGLFEVNTTETIMENGQVRVNRTTKITQKGMDYFLKRYCTNAVAEA